jgi:hypothetical protein
MDQSIKKVTCPNYGTTIDVNELLFPRDTVDEIRVDE